MHEVVLMDGGMGQELIRRSGKAPTPLWSATVMLEQPELVEALHVDFIQAGAEVITINAYSSTPERLARDADVSLFDALQTGACEVAQRARDKAGNDKVRIAGCLPPLVASYRPDLAPGTERSLQLYRQICDMQARHVDLFLCETMASQAEAVTAAGAACETGLPTWLALTLDDRNPQKLRGGDDLSDVLAALRELPLQGLLLNCSRPETIEAAWQTLIAGTEFPVGAYANGFTAIDALQPGGTVSSLQARNDLPPEHYADFAMRWVTQGASMVGGCCEVGPEHIACLRRRLDERSGS
ncbi:homocysteine S-methyltransferase family protein [Granulosicoccus sp. 3-233]|uniref:homocysteine S-methyltransferase family protein n=1 Tax=Granulosicoccus sp. 3-233 TaxID=3417969 RepID=UPI003D33339C